MKKKDLDWSVVGLLASEILALLQIIREVFERLAVGIEIIPWLCGEGKDAFIKEFLEPLGKRFSETQRIKVIDENTILVNLGIAPTLPFKGAAIEKHNGEGWVEVQKRPDGLYVGGRKVILYWSENQTGGKVIGGHKLRDELTGKPVLNANLLDALLVYPALIPEDWKQDAKGRTIFVFFWDTLFRHSDGHLYVRYLSFSDGRWSSHSHWVDYDFDDQDPAACLQVENSGLKT